ncbi:MAG: imidazole glycerol phosphate synthase subunit HisH [Alphaproteobacteria bacterium]|nr:imidazole glycerol phosphate synthase subunit HisH [Alphaproteobacteria bacterium]
MSGIALIDYGSGNLRSAEKALARAAHDSANACPILVTANPEDVVRAERIVLPGVGAFADCMQGLSAIPGMVSALSERVRDQGAPFLGICVGMQLLAEVGHEFGDHAGLGWIAGDVTKLHPSGTALKIPHMGWNGLRLQRGHPLFAGILDGAHVYFVHSYAMRVRRAEDVVAVTDYGGDVVSAVARDNVAGVQFHPEKSQAVGLQILSNFLAWKP